MKGYKSEITLNEKDSLTDMLLLEKELVKIYASALTEGATRGFRNAVKSNLDGAAGDQYAVFSAMQKQGLYDPTPADRAVAVEKKQNFTQIFKELAN